MSHPAARLALPAVVAQPALRVTRRAVLLMAASGFAALGYQIVWLQQCALWLGHETPAVLAVVTAFFGGTALGALLLGPRIDASPRPARWYQGCEAAIGLWCLAFALAAPWVSTRLLELIGSQPSPAWQWSVVFVGTFLLLLPATAAMGATLPAMERLLRMSRLSGEPIAVLYAANTLGAVLGVLAAAFLMVPVLGLWATTWLCAVINLGCAIVAARIFPATVAVAPRPIEAIGGQSLAVLAATGFLGIGFEVLVVRVLSQVAENTVYTFAVLLAAYLAGTSLGAAAYGRWLPRETEAPLLRDRLLRLLAGACLLSILSLAGASAIKDFVTRLLGGGLTGALAAEAFLALAAFLPATFVMGALFSHLTIQARAGGVSFGRAIGVNTLGAACAPPVCGLLLLPRLGSTFALLAVAAAYLLLASRRAWRQPAQLAAAAATLAIAAWAPSLAHIRLPPGGRVLSHAEGAAASVSVLEDAAGVATLHINNRQQEGSSATVLADGRQGLLPILLHPAPRRALFLGLGTGITSRSAALDAGLSVDVVELLPEVISASSQFTGALGAAANPRFQVINADARRFVRTSPTLYDVVVADNFHPARSGSGALYTVEHFAAVRERLAPHGLFCQWLPLHQLDLDTLRSIVRSYLRVYPQAWAMLATNSLDTPVVGLVARRDGARLSLQELHARLGSVRLAQPPADFGVDDEFGVLGGFVAGPAALARFAADAPANTDDRPVVSYRVLRTAYAPAHAPRERLLALLHAVSLAPQELADVDGRTGQKLAAYWRARDLYLEIGSRVRPTGDLRAMLAQVQEPLLQVLAVSPDYRPAHDPLLRMANALAVQEPAAGRELLARLHAIAPGR